MRLHVIKAGEGDGLLLESGDSTPRRLLIDGGPRGCWDADVEPHLREILGTAGRIEALLVSHVDNDHIVAPLDMLADIERRRVDEEEPWLTVGDLWHNAFERTLGDAGERAVGTLKALSARAATAGVAAAGTNFAVLGIGEGARLRRAAIRESIPLNAAFGGGLICPDELQDPHVELGSMRIRVVGPTRANLEALRRKWLEWAAKAGAAKQPEALANSDTSVPNLSSVVILAEEGGRSVLLTGDARGDHIVQGLDQAGLLRDGRMHVNVLKLQHHGSARNTTRRFFDVVTADTYVVSANGRYGNPDAETLGWIVEAAKARDSRIRIVATYPSASIEELKRIHPPAPDWYAIDVVGADEHAAVLEV